MSWGKKSSRARPPRRAQSGEPGSCSNVTLRCGRRCRSPGDGDHVGALLGEVHPISIGIMTRLICSVRSVASRGKVCAATCARVSAGLLAVRRKTTKTNGLPEPSAGSHAEMQAEDAEEAGSDWAVKVYIKPKYQHHGWRGKSGGACGRFVEPNVGDLARAGRETTYYIYSCLNIASLNRFNVLGGQELTA